MVSFKFCTSLEGGFQPGWQFASCKTVSQLSPVVVQCFPVQVGKIFSPIIISFKFCTLVQGGFQPGRQFASCKAVSQLSSGMFSHVLAHSAKVNKILPTSVKASFTQLCWQFTSCKSVSQVDLYDLYKVDLYDLYENFSRSLWKPLVRFLGIPSCWTLQCIAS